MTPEWVHPGLVLIVGAWFVPLLKGVDQARRHGAAACCRPGLCILMEPGTYGVVRFLGQELVFGRVDPAQPGVFIRLLLVALVGMIYSLHVD